MSALLRAVVHLVGGLSRSAPGGHPRSDRIGFDKRKRPPGLGRPLGADMWDWSHTFSTPWFGRIGASGSCVGVPTNWRDAAALAAGELPLHRAGGPLTVTAFGSSLTGPGVLRGTALRQRPPFRRVANATLYDGLFSSQWWVFIGPCRGTARTAPRPSPLRYSWLLGGQRGQQLVDAPDQVGVADV